MTDKFLNLILNIFLNNKLILFFKYKKYRNNEFDHDFLNISFENYNEQKKIFFVEEELINEKKNTDIDSYHQFNWLLVAKKIGGFNSISLAKKHIFAWEEKKYNYSSLIWNSENVAKRLVNMIYNYDFFASSADAAEKDRIKKMIIKHYCILSLQVSVDRKFLDRSIEIFKSLLLFELVSNQNYNKTLQNIKKHLFVNLNSNSVHKGMNPSLHAEYINHLIEIKNMCLYFKVPILSEIEFQILNMSAVLKNYFHKDNSIALFNGSNNANIESIVKIVKQAGDIKAKELNKIKEGIAIFNNNNSKIFFDVVKPSNKLIQKTLHSGTLGIEISLGKEKLITNCGSIEKRIGKKPEFLRYSAAHSTITLNNTNITELVEKKSYRRGPQKLYFKSEENIEFMNWVGSHDGYLKNFNKVVKRNIKISKNSWLIEGVDEIISIKNNSKKVIFNIRFHLTPSCTALLTNNKYSVLIRTKKNNSFIFTSDCKLTLDDSIYINNGRLIEKTKQIVISGHASIIKKSINWSFAEA